MEKIGIRKIENLQPTSKLLMWLVVIASIITGGVGLTLGALAISGIYIWDIPPVSWW